MAKENRVMTFINLKWVRILAAMTMTSAVIFGTAGCKEKGPAEELGEKIDEAADDAGDALEDAADKVEDAVDND
jgi:hypothetical protein